MKTALITGVTGQGGSYLAKLLLEKGYQVVGTTRDHNQVNVSRLHALKISDQVSIQSLDLQDSQRVLDFIDQLRPEEIYHLAAPSSVARSFLDPAKTIYSIALTTANILDAVRKTDKAIPIFVANSTEMFGNCEQPATVTTIHNPKSPYGIGKSSAHYQTRNYREAYNLFAVSGILSNFESPLRPQNYVTAKIVRTACKIALGEVDHIELGNLQIERDWGAAEDMMQAAWLSLQQKAPDDYVIATGVTSSLEEFLKITFNCLDLNYQQYLKVEPSLMRPLDIRRTVCDVSVTTEKLAWQAKSTLQNVIQNMLFTELERAVGPNRAHAMLGQQKLKVVSLVRA